MSTELALRLVGGVLAGIFAWEIALPRLTIRDVTDPALQVWALSAIVVACFGIAFLATPYLTTRPFYWALDALSRAQASDLLAGALGVLVGLLVGLLLAAPLARLPEPFGLFLPAVVSLLAGYFAGATAVSHKRELFTLLGLPWNLGFGNRGADTQRVVVDTSAIIDGRIADIVKTGFLPGPLVVPRFVLGELHRLADLPDPLRRNRGKRGLDVLARLQKEPNVRLEILEADTDDDDPLDVDAQLVVVARSLHCPIVTNDYNLNRVASIQDVSVLNVNELANAVRIVLLPGEELALKITQEGKEFGQGVGYLDDGTMVVVENGRHLLNTTTSVVVSRVLQTVAGRMIFAHPKQPAAASAYSARA